MPELPDLVYLEKRLNSIVTDKKITGFKITEPIVFRILISKGLEEVLINSKISSIYRHGPFLIFKFINEVEIVLHPMLAGRLKFTTESAKPGRGLCFSLHFEDGSVLHYLDNKKMGKVYLIKTGAYEQIPKYLSQGLDILSDLFTIEKFKLLIQGQRKQVRVFLMQQSLLSAIGNAYADEILFDARIHPKTFCYQLILEDIEILYDSIRRVIAWGIDEVEKAREPIEVKVRGHVKVRNRKDQLCPRCGTTIRRAGVLGYDTFFCPTCQPAARKQFIKWQ